MKDFIIHTIQVGACLSFFGIVYFLFLRKQTFFKFNRAFLLMGLLMSFSLPFVQITYDVIITAIPTTDIPTMSLGIMGDESTELNIWQVLGIVYLLGIGVLIVRNIRIFRSIWKLKQKSLVFNAVGYNLIDSTEIKTPFSFFNSVFINTKGLQEKEKNIILKHEVNHINQKHWIDLLCSECALILQWFNPIMWYYIYLLKENHEYLADQAVLEDGESAVVYRAVLINQRFQGSVFSFTNSFNYSNQKNRLRMLIKTKTSPWMKITALAVLPLFGAFFALSAKPNYVMDRVNLLESTNQDSLSFVASSSDSKINMSNEKAPLIIISGKASDLTIGEVEAKYKDQIQIMQVFLDELATEKYGDEGKHGVINIILKGEKAPYVAGTSNKK